ncbi:MAG: phosphomannomutase [Pseudomonadota bacterium]
MSQSKTINQLMQESQVSFGTSGARGLVSKMTDQICYSYTHGFIQFLKQNQQLGEIESIAIAGDLRPSTAEIMNACAKAIEDFGIKVINCGYIASPAIALYGIENKLPTIMVTGSHIPDDRNGIKFNTPQGEILKTDEQQIREQEISITADLFDRHGMFTSFENYLPLFSNKAQQLYIQRFIDFFPANTLTGKKLGIYQHSGVARDDITHILKALGANVTVLNRSDVFIPVDTEAVRDEDHKLAKQWQQQYQFDAILSTDGDADRPLICDENGRWLRGDIIGILCAQYLGIKHLVTPISSNTAVEKSLLFNSVTRSKIGSPYVIAEMDKLLNSGNTNIAGYEANGGFLTADDIELNGKVLKKLPTRDALIVMLALLHLSKMKQLPLSLLAQSLPQRFTYSDRLKAIDSQISQKIIHVYLDKTNGKEKIEADFGRAFGQSNSDRSKLSSLDTTDGLRLTFTNNNIIHFRPSGNAPEFRCYTESNSMQLAQQINAYCLEKIREIAQSYK